MVQPFCCKFPSLRSFYNCIASTRDAADAVWEDSRDQTIADRVCMQGVLLACEVSHVQPTPSQAYD